MMITNVIDRRSNPYKSTELDFVVEPSSADNDIKGVQFHDPGDNITGLTYAELIDATIAEAIEWGNGFQLPITLHIYDKIHDFKPKHKIMIMDNSTMHKFEGD